VGILLAGTATGVDVPPTWVEVAGAAVAVFVTCVVSPPVELAGRAIVTGLLGVRTADAELFPLVDLLGIDEGLLVDGMVIGEGITVVGEGPLVE